VRKHHILVAGLLSAILLGAESAAAHDPGTITKLEARRLPAEEVKRRTLEQLSRILTLETHSPTTERPKHLLSALQFWTKPRMTDVRGLCAADSVVINFRPTHRFVDSADTPTSADSIEARTFYRFAVPPTSAVQESRDWSLGPDNPSCLKIDPRHDPMFSAKNGEEAVEGIWLADEVNRQAKLGQFDFELSCSRREIKRDECIRLVQQLDRDAIGSVDQCQVTESETSTSRCVELDAWTGIESLELHVFVEGSGSNEKIVRVIVVELVIFADERED